MRLLYCTALLALAGNARAAPAEIVVIGIDAVSLNILDPFMKQGITPNMAKLAAEGARGELMSIWPLRTPQIWTTITTGKYPGQHGIWDHYSSTQYNPPKFRTETKKRLTTKDRRSKALWNILDERGKRALVVGWIASWPAETLKHGVIAAPAVLLDPKRQVSIKGSFWHGVPEQITPVSLQEKLDSLVVEGRDLTPEQLAPLAKIPPAGDPLYELPYIEKYVNALRWSMARATSVERLTLELFDDAKPDVVMAYFQCPDSLLHRFWVFQKSVEEIEERLAGHGIPTGQAARLKEHFGGVVEACYRDVDARVGRILEKTRGPNTLVVVLSDHGFGEAPFPHPKKNEPYGGNHRDEGMILVAGSELGANTWLYGTSVLDITPTLLYRLGLPVARDMYGRVLQQMVSPGADPKPTIQWIETYEKTPQKKVPYIEGWPSRKFRPVAVDE